MALQSCDTAARQDFCTDPVGTRCPALGSELPLPRAGREGPRWAFAQPSSQPLQEVLALGRGHLHAAHPALARGHCGAACHTHPNHLFALGHPIPLPGQTQPSVVASGAQVSPMLCEWRGPCPGTAGGHASLCAPCSWRPQTHHTKARRPCQGKGGRPARPRPRAWRPGESPERSFPSQSPDTEGSSGMAQPQGAHRSGAPSPLRQQPMEPTHATAWSNCRKSCSERGSNTGGENKGSDAHPVAHGRQGNKAAPKGSCEPRIRSQPVSKV